MPATLMRETQSLIADVERLTGQPVAVVSIPNLDVAARTTLASQATGTHVLQVRQWARQPEIEPPNARKLNHPGH